MFGVGGWSVWAYLSASRLSSASGEGIGCRNTELTSELTDSIDVNTTTGECVGHAKYLYLFVYLLNEFAWRTKTGFPKRLFTSKLWCFCSSGITYNVWNIVSIFTFNTHANAKNKHWIWNVCLFRKIFQTSPNHLYIARDMRRRCLPRVTQLQHIC